MTPIDEGAEQYENKFAFIQYKFTFELVERKDLESHDSLKTTMFAQVSLSLLIEDRKSWSFAKKYQYSAQMKKLVCPAL